MTIGGDCVYRLKLPLHGVKTKNGILQNSARITFLPTHCKPQYSALLLPFPLSFATVTDASSMTE